MSDLPTFAIRTARRLLAGLAAWTLISTSTMAAETDRRLVIVTLDGMSWTEVFRGADPAKVGSRSVSPEPEGLLEAFVAPADRARALMPFLHETVAKQGVLIGDRDHGSCAKVANDKWFSYPGYNEILTGKPDPKINSNAYGPNANVTVLEWLNRQPGFAGKVRALGSWAVFHDILNPKRSGLPLDAGWSGWPAGPDGDAAVAGLAADLPRLWPEVRYDALTHRRALAMLRREAPRVMFVSYGETDEFAHMGRYDQMLWAAHRTDRFLYELWGALQADPRYRGRTTLIITTDHGRGAGAGEMWRNHGAPVFTGSDAVWMGILGPDAPAGARFKGDCATSSQIAATGLTALGLDWRTFDPAAGAPLEFTTTRSDR